MIIPTYNERENVVPLVERCLDALEPYDAEIIVVDDDSPDGTWLVAREFAAETDGVRVVRRRGSTDLATAVARGFREASNEACVVIDADFQHPPERIPYLFETLRWGAELAVASRYLEASRIEGWSRFRKSISRGAILLSWLLVPATRGLSDPISGFFAVRTELLEDATLGREGYKILLDLLVACDSSRVAEVPYVFAGRSRGESNLDAVEYVRFLRCLLSLRASSSRWPGERGVVASALHSVADRVERVERYLSPSGVKNEE